MVVIAAFVVFDPLPCRADVRGTEVFVLVNKYREAYGKKPLKVSRKLVTAAQEKANDMAEKNYFSHHSPEGKGVRDFVLDCGYKYRVVGENLAEGWSHSVTLVSAWMGSELHRSNILDGQFVETGIGIAQGNQGTLIVQLFGLPL